MPRLLIGGILIGGCVSRFYKEAGCDPTWPPGMAPLGAGALHKPVLYRHSSTRSKPGAALVYDGPEPQLVVHDYCSAHAVAISVQIARLLAGLLITEDRCGQLAGVDIRSLAASILMPSEAVHRLVLLEGRSVEWIVATYPVPRDIVFTRTLETLGHIASGHGTRRTPNF